MRSRLSKYWVCQIAGWGLFAAINIFFSLLFKKYNIVLLQRVVFMAEMGVFFSHIMREVIIRSNLLMQNLQRQIFSFWGLTLLFALLISGLVSPYEDICHLKVNAAGERMPYKELFFTNAVSFSVLLLIWNVVYFMYHYVEKSRKQQVDTLQLEALVKSLELKTIKAHINPHFIFNALNGIRALIDEDPERARTAITELSNILRSSLNTEKAETVTLQEELKIVRDYLALENMRFEDRLKVEYDIDADTLNQQVPPMMLQTLVENAIKHGISKQVKGGVVKIISDFRENFHELLVQNTGHLNGGASGSGFGISSTQDRLELLYGERARFQIRQVLPELVEAKVLIPVSLN